jgi:trans-aconitate methyltransferase
MKGTGLRPYLAALPATHYTAFLEAYTAALSPAYGPGPFEFEFRRLFLWTRKP